MYRVVVTNHCWARPARKTPTSRAATTRITKVPTIWLT